VTTRRPTQNIRDDKVGEALVDVDGHGQIARAFGFAL
jgi:hypothetical protein